MSNLNHTAPTCQVPDDILQHFLPGGGISILAGAPSVGKTALVAGFLRDLLAGRPIFGRQPRKVAWGYINTDRSWSKGAGLWLARAGVVVPYYSLVDDHAFDPRRLRRKFERVDLLASMIEKLDLPPDSGVLVDPMSLFLGGNLLDYDSCMCACLEIRAYLRRKQYTMLGLAHAGKLKADKSDRYVRTTDQILGSTAIPGFSDAVLHLATPEELAKSYYQLTWHPHGAKAETFVLDRDDVGLFVPWLGIDQGTIRRILGFFPDPPATIGIAVLCEYAETIPLVRRTVERALEKLIDSGYVEKVTRGTFRRIWQQ
jgi:hypothetical protein